MLALLELNLDKELCALDRVLDQLQHDLDQLRATRPFADLGEMSARVELANQLATDLWKRVGECATQVDLPAPTPGDREQLRHVWDQITQRLKERAEEAERTRDLLRALREELMEGAVRHRRQQRQKELEHLKEQAVQEIESQLGVESPPGLPSPSAKPLSEGTDTRTGQAITPSVLATSWFTAALQLCDPELGTFLTALEGEYPALAHFLCELDDPGWWQENRGEGEKGRRGEGEQGESQPSEEPTTPPTSTSSPDVLPLSPSPLLPCSPASSEEEYNIPPLPMELHSHSAFQKHYWLAPSGECEPAPWQRQDLSFPMVLQQAIHHELHHQVNGSGPAFFRLWVYVRALEELGQDDSRGSGGPWIPFPLTTQVLQDVADVWDYPRSRTSSLEDARVVQLRQAIHNSQLTETPRWKWTLFLEAVRPGRGAALTSEEACVAVESARYHDRNLRHVVLGLLELTAQGFLDPIGRLQQQLRAAPPESTETLLAAREEKRAFFHAEVKRLWSAAGGKIKLTHCRVAWGKFIEKIAPLVQDFYPQENGGKPDWDPRAAQKNIQKLVTLHREVADQHDVKFQDRNRMDRAARLIADLADEVNKVQHRLHQVMHNEAETTPLPTEETRKLLDSDPLTSPDEEFCRLLLVRLLFPAQSCSAPTRPLLAVTLEDLIRAPDLLAILDPREDDLESILNDSSRSFVSTPHQGNGQGSVELHQSANPRSTPHLAGEERDQALSPSALVIALPVLPSHQGRFRHGDAVTAASILLAGNSTGGEEVVPCDGQGCSPTRNSEAVQGNGRGGPSRCGPAESPRFSPGNPVELPRSSEEDAPSLRLLVQQLKKTRMDLLSYLPSVALSAQELNVAHRTREDILARAHDVCGEIRRLWRDLDDLGVPLASSLHQVCKEALSLINEEEGNTHRPLLLLGWLTEVETCARQARDTAVKALRARVEAALAEEEASGSEVLRALERGHFGHVLWLLQEAQSGEEVSTSLDEDGAIPSSSQGVGPLDSPSALPFRETVWRWQARQLFADPLRELDLLIGGLTEVSEDVLPSADQGDATELASNKQEGATVISAWRKGITGKVHQADRTLRSQFAKLVFGLGTAGGRTRGQARKRNQRGLYTAEDESNTEYRIECRKLREYLATSNLNPSFLPQLADYRHLVILTPLVPPTDRTFVNRVGDLVTQAGRDCFPIVLAPKLAERVRQETLVEFRQKRQVPAAILDDLDLCRLLNPGGRQPNFILGLLEIAFEQQRWLEFSPFATPEGQNIRLEMYVGRRRESSDLSQTANYSRLFSGRKLGKSALLRYIEQTEDGKSLPSGNRLRVLYVPAAGAESEADVVDRILREMKDRLDFSPEEAREQGRTGVGERGESPKPGDHLALVMRRFVEDRPDESLLVVLDESDVFVETQLEECEKPGNWERCLSFRMRTDMQHPRDAQQLPRVRFLFSGYRATHTTGGAWVNWGDCLYLKPLTPEEAAQLVAGPLARLGIDASRQAPAIAYRCGYQPAVLLTFGRHLLRHLDSTRPVSLREERLEVTVEDVSTVFNLPEVQNEIRSVVKQNFQGNRIGLIVFSAVVLSFAELPPGSVLYDAEQVVLERLRQFGPLDWMEGWAETGASHLSTIINELRNLAARQLLVEQREPSGECVYRFRFPHHLTILAHQDTAATIRQEIAALRNIQAEQSAQLAAGQSSGNASVLGIAGTVRALVSPRAMSDLRLVVRQADQDFPARCAVVPSLWCEGVNHRAGGLADRLGIEPACRLEASALGEEGAMNVVRTAPYLAIHNASPTEVEKVLEHRPGDLPPPLFTGGVDLLRWILDRPSEELYELSSLGRLPTNVLRWWFERVRSLEFPVPDAIATLSTRTGGIPLLVRAFDQLLLGAHPAGSASNLMEGGFNVSHEHYHQVMGAFEEEVVRASAWLCSDDPRAALLPREIEILHMIATVCRANDFGAVDLYEHLTEGWELYQESCPLAGVQPLNESDRLPLLVVQHLGLIPTNPEKHYSLPFERLRPLNGGDPLLKVLAHLPNGRRKMTADDGG